MYVADSQWKKSRRSCECGEDLLSERTAAWVACLVPLVPLKGGSLYRMEAPHASTVLFCSSASLGVRAGLVSQPYLSQYSQGQWDQDILAALPTASPAWHESAVVLLCFAEALQTWVCISAVPLPRVTAAHSGLVLTSALPALK